MTIKQMTVMLYLHWTSVNKMFLALFFFQIKVFLKNEYTNGLWGPVIIPQFILILDFSIVPMIFFSFTFCHCKRAHADSVSHTQCIQLTPFLRLSFAWSATFETIPRAAETKHSKEKIRNAWLAFHIYFDQHIQIQLRAKVCIPHDSNATWEWNRDEVFQYSYSISHTETRR